MTPMNQPEAIHYVKTLNARRKRQRIYSGILIIFGITTIVDSGSNFPVPLTGFVSFAVGTICVIIGLAMLAGAYKLPIREALLFASLRNGKMTAPALSMELDITLDTAELIINQLVKKGYAQISTEEMEAGTVVYKISGIDLSKELS